MNDLQRRIDHALTSRETISHDAEGAKKACRLLKQRDALIRAIIQATHKHAEKHQNCDKPYCCICEGGLFVCADCGAAEIEAEERICTGAAPVRSHEVGDKIAWLCGLPDDELEMLRQYMPDEALAALRFYADKRNWTSGRWVRGSEEDDDADEPVEGLICIDHQFEEGIAIPFADCGERARRALSTALASVPAGKAEALVSTDQHAVENETSATALASGKPGWRLVPEDPTEAMTIAMRRWENPILKWKAALEAAPLQGGREP